MNSDRVRALVGLDTVPKSYLYVGRFVDPNVLGYVNRTKQAASEYAQSETRRFNIRNKLVVIFGMLSLLLVASAFPAIYGIFRRVLSPQPALMLLLSVGPW